MLHHVGLAITAIKTLGGGGNAQDRASHPSQSQHLSSESQPDGSTLKDDSSSVESASFLALNVLFPKHHLIVPPLWEPC